MRCPFCKADNDKVIDSRSSTDGFVIRRRRECLECVRRFTTYERIEDTPIRVAKKDGGREAFETRQTEMPDAVIPGCDVVLRDLLEWQVRVAGGRMSNLALVTCHLPIAPNGYAGC